MSVDPERRVPGGVLSARGLHFQYLRTLEELFAALEEVQAGVARVSVEGSLEDPDLRTLPTHREIIDYALEGHDGTVIKVAQVKSAIDPTDGARRYGAPEAFRCLLGLVAAADSRTYELITNAPLTERAQALATILVSGLTKPSVVLRDELFGLFKRSDELRERVGDLDPEQLDRLRRARVTRDLRTVEALRNELRQRTRRLRLSAPYGAGTAASGLLIGYLENEIFLLAGSLSEHRSLSLEEFRNLVYTPNDLLAEALGRYDSGVPVGPLPAPSTVERTALLDRIAASLRPTEDKGRVKRCALMGLSGIGKSCLAAAYAYEYADCYDRILWVTAHSQESTRAGFEEIRAAMSSAAPRRTSAELRDAVHSLLSEYPGTWLLILDNVHDEASIDEWVPRSGRGDVVVTSTNSTAWLQYDLRLPVQEMEEAEAVALLYARLNPSEPRATPELLQSVTWLAQELQCWPLALELAAGYLVTADRGLEDVRAYVDELKGRALDARIAVPQGYPRTLVAAILWCIDRVRSSCSTALEGLPVDTALECLFTSCYLSPKSVPINLLVACATSGVPNISSGGSPASQPSGPLDHVLGDDVVRVLRSESLIQRERARFVDDPAPSADVQGVTTIVLKDLVSFNELVHTVVLQQILEREKRTATEQRLSRAAYHVQAWLAWFLDNRVFVGVRILEPHAAMLLSHVDRLRSRSDSIALLQGNVSNVYAASGRYAEAAALLAEELRYLRHKSRRAPLLELKVRQGLATALVRSRSDGPEVLEHLLRAAELAKQFANSDRSDVAGVVWNLKQLVRQHGANRSDDPKWHRLAAAVEALTVRGGGIAAAEHDFLDEASAAIRDDRRDRYPVLLAQAERFLELEGRDRGLEGLRVRVGS